MGVAIDIACMRACLRRQSHPPCSIASWSREWITRAYECQAHTRLRRTHSTSFSDRLVKRGGELTLLHCTPWPFFRSVPSPWEWSFHTFRIWMSVLSGLSNVFHLFMAAMILEEGITVEREEASGFYSNEFVWKYVLEQGHVKWVDRSRGTFEYACAQKILPHVTCHTPSMCATPKQNPWRKLSWHRTNPLEFVKVFSLESFQLYSIT